MRALKVVWLPMSSLKPYENNARTHSDEQVLQIANSLREFGWTNPILIDKCQMVIAGHGRLLGGEKCKALGWKIPQSLDDDKAPTICLEDLTEDQVRAYILADNQLALNAAWDPEKLAYVFKLLAESGFEVEVTGFSKGEVQSVVDPDWAERNAIDKIVATDSRGDAIVRVKCGENDKNALVHLIRATLEEADIKDVTIE